MKVPSRIPFFPTPPEQAAKPLLSHWECWEPMVPKEGELGAWHGGLNPHMVIVEWDWTSSLVAFHVGLSFSIDGGPVPAQPQPPQCFPSCPVPLQRRPCIMQQRETKLRGTKADGCSPAAVWSCLSFPAGGHLSRLRPLVELFNPLNLQPKYKGSFSRLCKRARPPQTQMGVSWEPDVGQGDPGRTSSLKQGAWRGFAPGAGWQAKSCSLVSQTQPPSCVRAKRKPT